MTVSCKELRSRAWNRLKGNYWQSLGVSLIGSIIAGVLAIVTAGPMNYGVISYYVAQQRGENPEFGDAFDGFNRFGDTFLGNLLMMVFIFLWGLIPIVGGIIALVKGFSYSMTYYVMKDENLDANTAITRSRELMDGCKWDLFKLRLSFIGWILLSMLTFGIGLIFLAPYMQAAEAEFYAHITNR